MLSQASSSHPPGIGGSGALSHIYVQYPPLRCGVSGFKKLFYDDGNKLLLALTADQVFSWKTSPFDPQTATLCDPISEGPVLSLRYSLDSKLLAIQRSINEVVIWNKESGVTFSQKCRAESETILGFFWTDCPTCDIIFVKTSGLDLFSYNHELKSLRLVETKKLNVSWYIYTHESRLVILASGMQCKTFTGFQLSSVGIIRLPKFEMVMAKSEANNKPVLASEDVHIVTVYGRIYCLQYDRVAMLLHSYRFYRDAVVQQGSLPIYSNRIGISVVDNVLLVHQVDAKVVIIYDLFGDSRAPISAPLPLLLRGFTQTHSLGKSVEASDSKDLSADESIVYGDNWTFLVPDLICDVNHALLWKIHLDLEAISASSSEVPSIIEFLQRRKLEPNKVKHLCLEIVRTIILERRAIPMVAKAIDILITSYTYSLKTGSYYKGMKIDNTSSSNTSNVNSPTTIDESSIRPSQRSSVSNFSNSDSEDNNNNNNNNNNNFEPNKINEVNTSHSRIPEADNDPLNANVSEQESQVSSPAVSPDDLYSFVFALVEEEMSGDASYLVAIIIEFLRSANTEKVKIHPNMYVLTVQLLARSERSEELGLYIINKILEPSKEVALQLIESGHQNFQIRKLGLDMLRQLSLHHDYVVLLVQDGYYLEALRYARKNQVTTVRPSLFLEAAYAANDSQHLAAVLRFFSDFIPGFKSSSEHITYSQILSELSSSISV